MLLVELGFNLTAEFVAAFGDGQFHVFSHALFEVIGLATQLLLNVALELLRNVLFKTKAPAFILHFETGFALLQSLTQLLFEAGSNATAELLFSFGQQGFMPFLKSVDFQAFHFDEPSLHLLFEVRLDVSEALLEGLIVIEAQSFFLDGQTAIVFLVELCLNGSFHLGLSFLQALMLFHTVLFVECLDLAFKAQVEFVSSPCFLGSQCVPFHRLEFGFHRPTKLVFQSVEG